MQFDEQWDAKKKRSYNAAIWNFVFSGTAVYLVAQYARYEIRRMEAVITLIFLHIIYVVIVVVLMVIASEKKKWFSCICPLTILGVAKICSWAWEFCQWSQLKTVETQGIILRPKGKGPKVALRNFPFDFNYEIFFCLYYEM